MWGQPVSPRARCAWPVAVLCIWCLSVAQVIANPEVRPAVQQAASCRLNIRGAPDGRLQQASMSCTGSPTATVHLNATYLASFQDRFTGVRLAANCTSRLTGQAPCLITVCSGTIVLQDSSVTGVHILPEQYSYLSGLVCVVHDSRLVIYNSTFSNHQVRPFIITDQASVALRGSTVANYVQNADGGGALVEGEAALLITDGSRVHGNAAELGGGVFARESARVTVSGGTSISANKARLGAGVCADGNARVTLADGSRVHGNTARDGGGVHASGTARVSVAGGSIVSNNTARGMGGGIAAWGNANVTLVGGCSVHGNNARLDGGGVAVGQDARVVITSCRVHGNSVQRLGGGLYAEGAFTVTVANSSMHGNRAQYGGGVVATGSAHVSIADGSIVSNNSVWMDGGGMHAWAHARFSISGSSSVHGNVANKSGGGLSVHGVAEVVLINSNIHSNTAGEHGGGVYAYETSKVVLNVSSIHSNKGLSKNHCGGGLTANGRVTVNMVETSVHNNTTPSAGGGICAWYGAQLVITDHSAVHGNQAGHSGGGLFLSQGVVLDISGGCIVANNTCMVGVGGGFYVGIDGGLSFGGMGRLEREDATTLNSSSDRVTISNSTIANNTVLGAQGAGGGLAVMSRSTVILTDGVVVSGNRVVNGSGGAVMLSESASFQADSTAVFADNMVTSGYVGRTIVAFGRSNLSLPGHGQLTKCSTDVYRARRPCDVGETLQHDVCLCCPPHTFGFANSNCTQCPLNAACPGANIVQPLPGYWSSGTTSFQIHRCPLFKTACEYLNATHTCRPGYRGPLCGDCQLPGYGMLSPMRCGRCMQPSVQLGLYLLFSSVSVVFVAYTVHATWQENLKGNRTVLVTDYIKVLVLFLQYLVIIGSVSVPWPLFDVQQWLQAIGIVVALGSGQALSLDCWLHKYIPQGTVPIAIQRQLVYFLAPVCALLLVWALQCMAWAVQRWGVPLIWKPTANADVHGPKLLLRKLPVTMLVLVFYAYPVLLRASLSFFACLSIDKPLSALSNVPMGAIAPLSHRWGYWVSSIEQQCFTGYHLRWAMGLGLPSVLLWCLVVPVAMGNE